VGPLETKFGRPKRVFPFLVAPLAASGTLEFTFHDAVGISRCSRQAIDDVGARDRMTRYFLEKTNVRGGRRRNLNVPSSLARSRSSWSFDPSRSACLSGMRPNASTPPRLFDDRARCTLVNYASASESRNLRSLRSLVTSARTLSRYLAFSPRTTLRPQPFKGRSPPCGHRGIERVPLLLELCSFLLNNLSQRSIDRSRSNQSGAALDQKRDGFLSRLPTRDHAGVPYSARSESLREATRLLSVNIPPTWAPKSILHYLNRPPRRSSGTWHVRANALPKGTTVEPAACCDTLRREHLNMRHTDRLRVEKARD